MKYAVILLGIALLLFGCAQEQPAPVQAPPEPNVTLCADGTVPGECSITQPFYCTADAGIIPDPGACGCPEGTAFLGNKCVINCSDGTPLAECSGVKPFYCTQGAQLVEDADACGCPEGMLFHDGTCISTCEDGTDARTCSDAHPYYCNENLALVPDFENCGCPSGTRLVDGDCVSAHCLDGTPVGSCTRATSNYCNEDMQIVQNPACGCPSGRIQSMDKTLCVNARTYPYPEGADFNISTGVSIRVADSIHPACRTGEYMRVNVVISNTGSTPFNMSEGGLTVLQRFQSGGYRWNTIGAPVNDSLCVVREPFQFGEVAPHSSASGQVWFTLLNWQPSATYDLFYQDKNVRLTP